MMGYIPPTLDEFLGPAAARAVRAHVTPPVQHQHRECASCGAPATHGLAECSYCGRPYTGSNNPPPLRIKQPAPNWR